MLTQADLNAGALTNEATATGTPASGPAPVSPVSTVTIEFRSRAALTLAKSASPANVGSAGERVTYSFVVTNVGSVTVTDVSVNETAFNGSGTLSPIACPTGAVSLAPAAQVTCTATYVVTHEDRKSGKITNTAVATGTTPGGTITSDPASAEISATDLPVTGVKLLWPVVGGIGLLLLGSLALSLGARRRQWLR